MTFDDMGRVREFGVSNPDLERHIQSGLPFRTSGCPGPEDDKVSACNRPYGDSAPSDIRSFPFPPQHNDLGPILKELGDFIVT